MGKTETINKRRVDVYLKSEEQKKKWTRFAKKRKTSLSKLIIDTMESLIGGGLLSQLDLKDQLIRKNEELASEIDSMNLKNRRHEKYIEILEMELNRSRNISFSEPGPGFRYHNEDLIKTLKESKVPISNQEILGRIGVNPVESQVVKSISNQLEALASYGLIKYTNLGWVWNG